jgi:predicted SprT family Zn-dependent metalloprotease
MALLFVWMFTGIFGTVMEEKEMSEKDRLERKKYMGMCRCGSEIIARMMSRLPRRVTRYIERNSLYMGSCNSDSSENPRRNSEILI